MGKDDITFIESSDEQKENYNRQLKHILKAASKQSVKSKETYSDEESDSPNKK